MASGDTKTEALLNILGNGGTGDEYRGSGNTKTQNYILDAIDRINALDPGGGGSAIKYIELTITGASGSDVNVTASEYLDDLVTKIDSGVECVFKLTIPLDAGLPLGGTFLFRVSNYFPDGSNIWCFSPFYDNLSNVMYMLKLEFVPVNGNYHTQSAVVHIFMP